MPSPNLPPGFDPTDPDINLKGLPVEEFAELRKAAPIWWCETTPGHAGGFNDGGYWVITKHKDVKEISRRSDIFSSYENCVIPRFNDDIAREDIEVQRHVMLNMDAPHHTRLRKIISRGFTPRAVGRLRDELNERAQKIAQTAASQGAGDFVEQVSCELPLQAIAGLLGIPQEDRDKIFRWSNEMTGNDDPEYADVDAKMSSAELIMYAMKMAEEKAKNPGDDIVTALIEADIEGEKLSDDEFGFFVVMLSVAGNETTRNSITHGMIAFADNPDQWELYKKERPETAADEIVRWATPVSCFQRTALEDYELSGVHHQEGPAGGDVLPVGQLRRRSLRRPVHVQHPAQPQPARGLRWHRCALLHRRQPGQVDDRPDLQRRRRPHARPDADLRAGTAALGMAQRHQTLAGGLHRKVSSRRRAGESHWRALMDFSLEPAQQAVADVVNAVLDRDNSWEALVSGGVTALPVPERLGGDGVGLAEVATALTEIGRHGTVSPALATLGLGVVPLLDLATEAHQDRYLAGVAKGGVLTAALNEPGAALPDRPATTFANNRLSGIKIGVPYAEQAEWILVTADSCSRRGVADGRRRGTDQDADVQRQRRVCRDVLRRRCRIRGSTGRGDGSQGEPARAGDDRCVCGRPGRRGAATDGRLRRQPAPVRQAAVDVPNRRRSAGRGVHRLADNHFGVVVGDLAIGRGP